MTYLIRRLQEYYGHQWNEIGRIALLGDELIYHFARNQTDPKPQPWQIRNIQNNLIMKQWYTPNSCSGWPSVVGKGLAIFGGQADISDDPNHQNPARSANWQPAYVVVYDGSNFTYIQIPDTDTLNEFYSLTFNPDNGYFYAGETDFNNPSDWSDYKAGGGIWRSFNGYNWSRIWQDPHICNGINVGRVIQTFYLNGKVYTNCDKSTLDGVCVQKPIMNSIFQITPTVQKLFDYDKDVRPFHIPEYVWKDRIWCSGLVSFDGTEIKDWNGSVPKGQLYPIGLDKDGNLLLRITKEDYSQGGYTVGRVYDIDGSIEIIADNWIAPPEYSHAIATKGGAVTSNNKLYLGVWHSQGGATVYGALDTLKIKEGEEMVDYEKIRKDTQKELAKLPTYNYWLERILTNLSNDINWFNGLPYTWWHGPYGYEWFLTQLMEHIDLPEEPLWRLRKYS